VKVLGRVAPPPTLDVRVGHGRRRTTLRTFHLRAVVAHVGASARGGHYVAYIRVSKSEDAWVRCDDSVVTPVRFDAVAAGDAGGDSYLLWYVAVST
jgi:ubiquitin C-terminal hydrolase